jgi:hypothetical protein
MDDRRHLILLSLLGWYLMLPPAAQQQNGLPWPDGKAPISQWTIAESFDKAKACEAELDKRRKGFQQTYNKISHQFAVSEFWTRFYVAAAGAATCVATDDPRLKEGTDNGTSDVKKSSANWRSSRDYVNADGLAVGIAAGNPGGSWTLAEAFWLFGTSALLLAMPQHGAMGQSSAASIPPIRLPGALEYYRQGHVNSPCAAVRLPEHILELWFDASYLRTWAMSIRFHSTTLKATTLLKLAACVVSVLMLLVFPIRKAHQFTIHFRSPEVRRSIERHTPIAQPESEPAERIAHHAVLPTLLVPIDTGDAVKPVADFERSPQVSLSRLLLRLKLGSSRSGSQDPLL